MTVPVALIAAVAENGVIGAANTIPWRIPGDMAFFRRSTMGKPIVMGRKQFETVGRPLPGRSNILLTRQPGYAVPGVEVAHDLGAALALAQAIAARDGAGEVMVIGGGEIYRAALPLADRLYISHVALAPAGDVMFPAIDAAIWQVIDTPDSPADPRDEAAFEVKVYAGR
jgi:dihydrofolate reductase